MKPISLMSTLNIQIELSEICFFMSFENIFFTILWNVFADVHFLEVRSAVTSNYVRFSVNFFRGCKMKNWGRGRTGMFRIMSKRDLNILTTSWFIVVNIKLSWRVDVSLRWLLPRLTHGGTACMAFIYTYMCKYSDINSQSSQNE